MRNRMFDIFSIKDVGINEKKVKQPLRSPKHAWCHRSQTGPKNLTDNNEDKKMRFGIVMDARSFEERILQQVGRGARESIPKKKKGEVKNVQEVYEMQSVVVGPHVSRHNTTTAESSLVKRSEEEVWSQKGQEDKLDDRRAGGAKKMFNCGWRHSCGSV